MSAIETVTPLLLKVREFIPTATQDQIDKVCSEKEVSQESLIDAKAGKWNTFISLLRLEQPGGIATVKSDAAPIVTTPEVTPNSVPSVPVKSDDASPIDRDWTTFNTRDLATLTTAELKSFKKFRTAEIERKRLLAEILELEANDLDLETKNLQSLTQAQTAHRLAESDRAAFNAATESADELLELARSAGTATISDQLSRDRAALEATIELGKQTPTQGEIGLAQAQGLQRKRLNALVNIQNGWASEVQPLQLTQAVTIDV
jgi:hypothetical protein